MQYIKKPLAFFLYRLIFSVFGLGLLSGLITNHVGIFSAILLIFNLPVFYSTAAGIAKDDKKSYRHTTPHEAKGLVFALLYLIPCAVLSVIIGVWSTTGNVLPPHSGFLLAFMPYRAMLTGTPGLSFLLPVLIDVAVITVGYIAGMKGFSVVRFFREHILYEKKEKNDKKKS